MQVNSDVHCHSRLLFKPKPNGSGREYQLSPRRRVSHDITYNIRVISFSMGRPIFESYNLDPLCQAVEAAWKAGIVVVVAAGNNGRDNSYGNYGYRTITSPGNDPYVITVGAMKTADTPIVTDDTIASYSSKGPTLLDHRRLSPIPAASLIPS